MEATRVFQSMSLRASLIASIVAVAFLTLLFGAVLSYWHALSKVDEEMQAAIGVGARIAANAVDDVEESADPSRRLHLLVADFDGDRHLRATWQDTAGRRIAQSTPAVPSRTVPDWFQSLIGQPEREVLVRLPPAFDGLGRFLLTTDSRNEIAEVWQDTRKTLAILGLLCCLVLASVYWLVGRALRPLDALAVSLDSICNSAEIPRIAETGPTEFIQVYRGFNGMADRLQLMEQKNRRLTEQLATVQEEERADLARDLHDEIGPFLFSVDVDAASIARCLEEGRQEDIAPRVSAIRTSISHMQRHVKELLGRLRSAAFVDVGLLDAIDNLASFWRARNPAVRFTIEAPDTSFGEAIDQAVFRIVQESMSNAMRHGQPRTVDVIVRQHDADLSVIVKNDGHGLKAASQSGKGTGFGISGMRERVAALGGTLTVEDLAGGQGVSVRALLPVLNLSTAPGEPSPSQRGAAAAKQDGKPAMTAKRSLTREQA